MSLGGRSLFRDEGALALRLLKTTAFDRGPVLLANDAAKAPLASAKR